MVMTKSWVPLVFMVIALPTSVATFPSDMLALMNTSANPCTDFYEYACGGWLNSYSLKPSEHKRIAVDSELEQRNVELIKAIAQENHPILGEFWESCMRMDRITEMGNEPLQHDLKRIADAITKEDVLKLAGEFSRTGTKAFLEIYAGEGEKDDYRLHVAGAQTQIPYLHPRFIEYVDELLKLSGFALRANAGHIVADVEQKLVEIDLTTRNTIPTKMYFSPAKPRWVRAFGSFWNGVGIRKTKAKLMKLYITKDYVDGLEILINSTPLNDLKTYLAFVMVQSRIHWLGDAFYQLWFNFYGVQIDRLRKRPARDSICAKNLLKYVPDLVGQHFNTKTFTSEQEEYVREILKLIQNSMEKRISKADWLGKYKQGTQNKVNKLTGFIGHKTLPTLYPPKMSRDNYPSNMYNIMSRLYDLMVETIGQRVNLDEIDQFSTKGMIRFQDRRNRLTIPTTILQPPYFNGKHMHPARNFGGIGSIIGHELTHGYDMYGFRYDEYGYRHNFYEEKEGIAFLDRTKCFEKQYSKFQVSYKVEKHESTLYVTKNVNGSVTLNANLADNNGVVIAWDAYRQFVTTGHQTSHGVNKEDGDRMFFIAFGQSWCTKRSDKGMRRVLDGHYSPEKWRVNGAVMNHVDFGTVFGCDVDTPMNPRHKCKLW